MTIAIKGTKISRRGVLAGLGGMSFCMALGVDGFRLIGVAQANTMANAQVTPWVRIAPDGIVTIYSAGAEMGQGSMTSLALIVLMLAVLGLMNLAVGRRRIGRRAAAAAAPAAAAPVPGAPLPGAPA